MFSILKYLKMIYFHIKYASIVCEFTIILIYKLEVVVFTFFFNKHFKVVFKNGKDKTDLYPVHEKDYEKPSLGAYLEESLKNSSSIDMVKLHKINFTNFF